ncbi:MAG TPA: hypothetical protein VLD38_08095 [Nitrosopumilaceae archaeon]|nr:hypothetical protein [Nitrosopumilaceae archaeon]
MIKIKFKKLATTSIIASLIIGLISLSTMITIPNVNAATTTLSQDCADNASTIAHSLASKLDETKAKSLASSNSEFNDRTQGYIISNSDIFNEWQINKTDCTPVWKDVNIVYFLNDTSGYAKNLVFTLDPELKTVIKVDEYKAGFAFISNTHWDGYEFYGNSLHSLTVYKAQAIYNHPTVSKPVSGPTCPSSNTCDLLIWTGLGNAVGASNGNLAQTGSVSTVNCSTNPCTTSYFMFYEFLPNAYVNCGSINANDQISAKITKGSGSSSLYDVSTVDTYLSKMCTKTGYSYPQLTNPTIAPFINERDCFTSSCSTIHSLAKFGTDTIVGYMQYNGILNSISVPYNNSYYTEDQMWNPSYGATHNVSHNGAGSGSFTETWLSSNNT